ncbi:MAG: DUF3391 domain-containing protein [Deltaproteobacteria bacterium]|nr:DUF3391 domain-containing protein [Deltaproteobacteria bacterium]
MIRRIRIEQLVPQMYVSRLDRSWLNMPLFRPLISSAQEVAWLKAQGIQEVYIDTDKGGDIPAGVADTGLSVAAQAAQEGHDTRPVPFAQEVPQATALLREAEHAVYQAMIQARGGHPPALKSAQAAVDRMAASILRNKDALASVVALKSFDENVYLHSVRVCVLSLAFASHLDMNWKEIKTVGMGALLHDIGKMRLAPALVAKAGPLDTQEYADYKRHSLEGAKLLDDSQDLTRDVLAIILQHHERPDGSGFPRGLSAGEISDYAKMVAIVDAFDNLLHKTQFQEKVTPFDALQWLRKWAGAALDSQQIEQFISAVGIYPPGSLVRMSDQRMGIILSVHHSPTQLPKVWVVFDANHRQLAQPEVVDLALQTGANPVTILAPMNPDKIGFNLSGYLEDKGLFSGNLPMEKPAN